MAHLQGVSTARMNGPQLMVIDISAIISILGLLNSDLLTDRLLENTDTNSPVSQSIDLDSSGWMSMQTY